MCGLPREVSWTTKSKIFKNSDGNIIDLSDLTTLSLHLLKDTALTKSEFFAADVSYDKKVNVADLAKLRQYLSNSNVILGPEEIIWR